MSNASNMQVGFFSAQTRSKGTFHSTMRIVLIFLIKVITPRVNTPRVNVFLAVESHDATIVARDNKLIEAEKRIKRIEAAKRLALLQVAV